MSHPCDLCDGVNFETIATLDRRGQPLETVVCRACGLVRHGRVPTEQELDDYYAIEYRRDYHGEVTPSDRRVARAWKNGQRLLAKLSPCLDRGARVFEIGAGIGCNVKAFELAGFSASGIEPGKGFQQYARNRLAARVDCLRLVDLPAAPAHDLILLVHVIEHFASPRRALEQIHALLPIGGRLYVECPNLAAPFAVRSRLFHFAHIHNFTPITLAGLAARCGYQIERNYTKADHASLQALLVKVEKARRVVDPGGYSLTMDALRRSNALAYRVRWNYVWPRLRRIGGYVGEYITAKRNVRELLAQCQSCPPSPAVESLAA
jgi:SAM-dependent methyltransferase